MLFPLDIIIAIVYRSVLAVDREASISSGSVLIYTALTSLVCLFTGEILCRLATRQLSGKEIDSSKVKDTKGRINILFRAFILAVYIFQLEAIGWPGNIPLKLGISNIESLNSILGLLPFLFMLSLSWLSFFRLEKLVSSSQWTRSKYVSFRIRFTMYMVIPWLMMWGLFDIGRAVYSSLWGAESFESFVLENSLSGFISIIMLACVAIFFPLILVKLWQCKPLKDEGLKSKLEALEEKTGITFSKIYVWNLGGSSFLNAAVMGMVKPFRFLLISKGILEHLTKDEICGVVAHEMGHVKHKHIISYFVITTAFVCIISYLLQMFDFDPKISAFLICLGMAVYIRIVFAYISRNFERQADLFGIEAMGTAEPLINSLEKIGFYSGNIRSSKSWHHGSIAERVDFLRNAEYDRLLRFMHHRHCTKIKAAGYIISISTLIFFLASPSPVPDEVHNALLTRNNLASYSTDEILKHWRRVSKLIKNDFESYAKMSEIEIKRNHYIPKQKADKIERWLDTAINNAQTTKQRMRVLDLLQQLEEKRNFLQKSSPAINI